MIRMKGPYERLKYDLRRLWECPQCHRRERTDGAVTFRICSCQVKTDGGQPIAMKLLEEAGHRTVPPIVPKISEEPTAVVAAPEPNSASAEPLSIATETLAAPEPLTDSPEAESAVPDIAQPPDDSSSSLPPE
jgi:hypothetical protein